MHTWLKASIVTVVSAVGIGFAAGSVLGDPEPLPDVGDPVVLESVEQDASSVQPPGSAGTGGTGTDDDDDDQVIHPLPWGEREARQERREQRREAREERGTRQASSGDDDDGGDDD